MNVPDQSGDVPHGSKSEPAAKETTSFRSVERRLIVMRVDPETLGGLDRPGAGAIIALGPPIDAYTDGWTLVSHTFEVKPGGDGLLSVLFERSG